MENDDRYSTLYCVHYLVIGKETDRYYDGSDLINLYKAGSIYNDTLIKKVKGKKSFAFNKLMENEVFYEELISYYSSENNTPLENCEVHTLAVLKKDNFGNPLLPPRGMTLIRIADYLKRNPDIVNNAVIWDENRFIPITSWLHWSMVKSLIDD